MTRASARQRLNTFAPPEPSPALIRMLVPVNRILGLAGIPGLRRVPILNWLPGIRGLADVMRVDFPDADMARLRAGLGSGTAAFIAKSSEISHRLVAGQGAVRARGAVDGELGHARDRQRHGPADTALLAQEQSIAQIPGEGGAAGKAYSVWWALQGHGVLLHPEGQVGWHADTIAPLFPGVVDMAAEAVQQERAKGAGTEVAIFPVVWRLRFLTDVDTALSREMAYVEKKLGMRARPGADVARRVHDAYLALLERDEAALEMTHGEGTYRQRQARVMAHAVTRLRAMLTALGGTPAAALEDAFEECRALLRPAERAVRAATQAGKPAAQAPARALAIARRLLRFTPRWYPQAHLSQEQVAENVKRLRADYCFGSLRDTVNRLAPRPAGPREVFIRVAEPIDVGARLGAGNEADERLRSELLSVLRVRMQSSLDRLLHDMPQGAAERVYRNPFAQPLTPSTE